MASKRIVIEPVTRVEGHGKVSILLDEQNRVEQARLHVVEFRGFERFIQGRPFWELPVLVQRLCGICPVSHHLCAAKAVDGIVGAEVLTPTAEKMRRLMHTARCSRATRCISSTSRRRICFSGSMLRWKSAMSSV